MLVHLWRDAALAASLGFAVSVLALPAQGAENGNAAPHPAKGLADAADRAADEMRGAHALLDRGQVDEAEKIYRSLLQSAPGTEFRIEAAFQIGQIHIRRGQYRKAILHFLAILNVRPELPRVRLELARAYFLEGDYRDAAFQFELLKGGNLPPEVLAHVDAFLDAIRRQKDWSVGFSFVPVSDSNINQVSGKTRECLNTAFGVLCHPLEKKSGGMGLNVGASFDYFRRFSEDWGLRASAAFYALEYKGHEFDNHILYAALGPRYLWDNGETSLQPTFRKRWSAGKPYSEDYGLRVDGRRVLGRVILNTGASYAANHYDDASIHNVLRGYTADAHVQPRYILNDRTFIQARLEFVREKTHEAIYANDNWCYSLGLYRILPYGFSTFLEGSLTQTRYRAPQWYATKDNWIDSAKREDSSLGLHVTLFSNLLEKYKLTPALRYSHTRRDSNIWSREYTRDRVDFMLDYKI